MIFDNLSGKKILDRFINSIVTEEPFEEGEDYEIEEEESGRRPSLKIYFLESEIKPPELIDSIYNASEYSIKARNLIEAFNFEVIEKESPYWLLVFKDKRYQLKYNYLIEVHDGFWEIYTIEVITNAKKTIQKLFDVSDKIDQLWLGRERLVEVVEGIVSPEGIHGFTAKRRTAGFEKKVTIRVFGGTDEDIKKAREHFFTEPTTIYFRKKNSPEAAVVGSLGFKGYLRIDKIFPDSIGRFFEAKKEIEDSYVGDYNPIVQPVEHLNIIKVRDDEGKEIAKCFSGYHFIIFEYYAQFWDLEIIHKAIDKVFLTNKTDYCGIGIKKNSYLIFDLTYGGSFRVRINEFDKQIIVTPEEGVSKKSLSVFCNTYIDKVEHSATPTAVSGVFE